MKLTNQPQSEQVLIKSLERAEAYGKAYASVRHQVKVKAMEEKYSKLEDTLYQEKMSLALEHLKGKALARAIREGRRQGVVKFLTFSLVPLGSSQLAVILLTGSTNIIVFGFCAFCAFCLGLFECRED